MYSLIGPYYYLRLLLLSKVNFIKYFYYLKFFSMMKVGQFLKEVALKIELKNSIYFMKFIIH